MDRQELGIRMEPDYLVPFGVMSGMIRLQILTITETSCGLQM